VNAPLSLSRAESVATVPNTLDARANALHEALGAQHLQIRELQATVDDLRGHPDAEATGREVAEQALRIAVETVREIDAALERIELGTYGRCERCGEAIAAARLDVLPHASRCVACPTGPRLMG
jgi:RNA polymerase-binding transcription factor DksA